MPEIAERAAPAIQPAVEQREIGAGALPIRELSAIAALACLIFFFHLGRYGLWDPDEGRYAEIAREMLSLREFLVPHLNYVAYVEKPPLLYWLTALSFSIFGASEFAARLFVAIFAAVGVIVTYLFAFRTFGRRQAILAGAILATSPLYAVMAQVLTTDMILTLFETVAMFAFFLQWREGGRWWWIFYLAMALAVLTKGPIGAALPLLSTIGFLLWERDLSGAIRRFHVIVGIALTLLIAAPWFVAVAIREPGFADFYFVGEHLRRAFVADYSHTEALWFYAPVIIGGLLPWSMLVPILTWRAMPRNPSRPFCVIGALVIVGVFSISSGKLVPYVLPAFPLLAILIADGIVSCAYRDASRPVRPPDSRILLESGPLLGLMGAIAIAAGAAAPLIRSPYPVLTRPALLAAGAILCAGCIAVTVAFLLRRTTAGIVAIVLTMVAALGAGSYARLEAEPMRSYALLSKTIAERVPDATLICYHRYVQALPFYTGRRVIIVGGLTELRFGAKRSSDRNQWFFTTDGELLRLWERSNEAVIVIDAADLARLRDDLSPYRVIATEGRKVAIVKIYGRLASN